MPIPVTLLYGGLLALLVVALGSWVSLVRLATGTRIGKPLPEKLVLPVRAHGNAAEWIPMAVVALLLLELAHVPACTRSRERQAALSDLPDELFEP